MYCRLPELDVRSFRLVWATVSGEYLQVVTISAEETV